MTRLYVLSCWCNRARHPYVAHRARVQALPAVGSLRLLSLRRALEQHSLELAARQRAGSGGQS